MCSSATSQTQRKCLCRPPNARCISQPKWLAVLVTSRIAPQELRLRAQNLQPCHTLAPRPPPPTPPRRVLGPPAHPEGGMGNNSTNGKTQTAGPVPAVVLQVGAGLHDKLAAN